ncbi:hypothetical protein [Alkalicoccus urumqiensis]|nr:hypothetical protein [Alkalicoccus urumqiensis]
MYIGMMRVVDYLMISYSGTSAYTDYFDQLQQARLDTKREGWK